MRERAAMILATFVTASTLLMPGQLPADALARSGGPDGGGRLAVAAAARDAATGGRSCPRQVFARMGLSKRVGQLFVAGVSSSSPTRAQLTAVHRQHLGGVILMGHDDIGVTATARVTHRLQRRAKMSGGASLWVAVDQEGGNVQVLNGPGFGDMPTALEQGHLGKARLRARAHRWGTQLRAAGINLDLAPVMDTVPRRLGTANKPIGYYDREYGHRPKVVAAHGLAVSRGMQSAGVQSTAKHFPGLGRVRRNTDTSAHVSDRVTTRLDPYLRPFRAAVNHGVQVVMVSLARYTRIDRRHIAAFSAIVMRRMLRNDLGFNGVVISDSMTAASVHDVPTGARAVRFLRAGGTVVLSVTTSSTAKMAAAVRTHVRDHRHFRSIVNRDALRVLTVKNRHGLLPCS